MERNFLQIRDAAYMLQRVAAAGGWVKATAITAKGSAVEGLKRILGSHSCFGTLKGSRTPGDAFGTALLLDSRYLLRIALACSMPLGGGAA